jgi:hypothetical protein
VAGIFECGTEPSGSLKGEKFLEQMFGSRRTQPQGIIYLFIYLVS